MILNSRNIIIKWMNHYTSITMIISVKWRKLYSLIYFYEDETLGDSYPLSQFFSRSLTFWIKEDNFRLYPRGEIMSFPWLAIMLYIARFQVYISHFEGKNNLSSLKRIYRACNNNHGPFTETFPSREDPWCIVLGRENDPAIAVQSSGLIKKKREKKWLRS